MCRAYTEEEARKMFLDQVRDYVRHWSEDAQTLCRKSPAQRVSGVAFSILALLDGDCADLPAFSVKPFTHGDDEAYHRKRGEKWFPDDIDIAGSLHEEFYEEA